MKRYRLFLIYLSFSAAMATLGYVFDATLGIWRQSIVGALLIVCGYILFGKQGRKDKQEAASNRTELVFSSVLLSFGILLAISLRLLCAKITPPNVLAHSDEKFVWRLIATALMPSLAVWQFHTLLYEICPQKKRAVKVLLLGISMLPFCTDWHYLFAAFVLGVFIGACDIMKSGAQFANVFVSYFVLLFYDTLSISIGSIDFNLSLKMVFSFLFISFALGILLLYLSLQVIKGKKFYIAEFLTVLLVCVILLLVAIAL